MKNCRGMSLLTLCMYLGQHLMREYPKLLKVRSWGLSILRNPKHRYLAKIGEGLNSKDFP